ncbi:MAG: NUDIX domain-containing protein [Dehalococcoidia bacterium]|nr:NUDIX domain-containing protein [Dehalococcoidia bacterium]
MTLGVRVLVLRGTDEVLLVRHTYRHGWFLPGGGVDRGPETLQDAATRELHEEAGISIPEVTLVGVYSNLTRIQNDHVVLFTARFEGEPGEHDHEIAEAAFFPLTALPQDLHRTTARRIEELRTGNQPQVGRW